MIIDDFMPDYDFNETHRVVVRTDPDRVFRAIKELKPQEVPVFRRLLAIRSSPARLAGRDVFSFGHQQPLVDQMVKAGFIKLDEVRDEELALGLIGQFWKIRLDRPTQVDSPQDFLEFDRKDHAKVVANFFISQSGESGGDDVVLSTETRICIPDPVAKRKFAVYWTLIYQGSSLIRRRWLRAIKHKAEGC